MVVSCPAFGCKNRFTKNSNLRFHRFPQDPERRKRWIHAMKRINFDPGYHIKICSEHFLKTDYMPEDEYTLAKPRLKHDAVPSIFPTLPLLRHQSPQHRCTSTCVCRPGPMGKHHQSINQVPNLAEETVLGQPGARAKNCPNFERNSDVAVETILKEPCGNEGCLHCGPKEEVELHGKKCKHRLVQCPFARFCQCPEVLPIYKILDRCYVAKQLQDGKMCNMMRGSRGFKAEMSVDNNCFVMHFAKVDARIIYVWVSIFGDAERASKYKAEISVHDGPMSITYQGKVFPIDEKYEDINEGEVDGVLAFTSNSKRSLKILNSVINFKILSLGTNENNENAHVQKINWWVCPECDLMTSTKSELSAHVKAAHDIVTMSCIVDHDESQVPLEDSKNAKQPSLKNIGHGMKKKSDQKSTFKTSDHLLSHFICHKTNEEAICRTCGSILHCKGGSTKSLQRHLRTVHNTVLDN